MERFSIISTLAIYRTRYWHAVSYYLAFSLLLILLSSGFFFGLVTFRGDGVGYYFLYRQLRAHNWSLTVTPESPDVSIHYDFLLEPSGITVFNQIGMPLFWYVFVPATRMVPLPMVDVTARLFAVADPIILKDGFSVLLLSFLASLGTIFAVARWTAQESGISFCIASLTAGIVFLGMPTWHYAFQAPSYSHITELLFLAGALLLYSKAFRKDSIGLFTACGILVGIAALIRMDALIYVAAFVCTLAVGKREKAVRQRAVMAIVIPAVLIGGIQYFVWFKLFGNLLPGSESYSLSSYTFPGRFSLQALFHPVNGLVMWSPIAVLGLYSILRTLRRRIGNPTFFFSIILVIFYIVFIGSIKYWWGGIAVGPRYFIPLYPVLVYGIAMWYADIRQCKGFSACVLISTALVLCAWYYMTAALMYPLVSQPGQSSKRILTLWQQGFGVYGAPTPIAYIRMARDTLKINPRVIHLIIPQSH